MARLAATRRAASRKNRVARDASLVADDPPYLPFHQWLLVTAATVIGGFVAVTSGALSFVLTNDTTFISVAVLALFVGTSAYCGARARRLSVELMAAQRPERAPADSWVRALLEHARSAPAEDAAQRDAVLFAALEERIRGPHEVGWFITETLTKLGLLGTVIGFLIMLTALVGSSQLELSAMQGILRTMASGMGIKIIATVVGLLCNMVLALQWLVLDRTADKILAALPITANLRA